MPIVPPLLAFLIVASLAGCSGTSGDAGERADRAVERGIETTGRQLWRDLVERPVRDLGREAVDAVTGE